MRPLSETISGILNESAKASDLEDNSLNTPLLDRYRKFLISFTEKYGKKPNIFRQYVSLFELALNITGAALGGVLIYINLNDTVKILVWVVYIVVFLIIGILLKLIDDDYENLYLQTVRLKLINLSERLAAMVALFDIISQAGAKDDKSIIQQISDRVPSFETLSEASQSIIRTCQDTSKVFLEARETNIVISKLNLESDTIVELRDALQQIADLCGYLFTGSEYTVKLYLRVNKQFDGSETQILVPFSKYPPRSQNQEHTPYGSSWIKTRGNPSVVWACLESGNPTHANDRFERDSKAYYKSNLAICLPGRIGVLSLTASSKDAFTNKYDQWAVKSLAVATHVLILRALGIDG